MGVSDLKTEAIPEADLDVSLNHIELCSLLLSLLLLVGYAEDYNTDPDDSMHMRAAFRTACCFTYFQRHDSSQASSLLHRAAKGWQDAHPKV